MARKANIAKEEIIEACWQLIEQNIFPNIPRLSQHFQQLDGRACSNTTLLNAITEWEERYRERQDSELSDLTENLAPSFKRFERDIANAMSLLLDEKVNAHEDSLALRQAALEGRSDSLQESYVSSQEEVTSLTQQVRQLHIQTDELSQQKQLLSERYEHALTRTRVLESEREQNERQLRESHAQLSQSQVDLAKQDKQIEMLMDSLSQARAEIQQLKANQHAEFSKAFEKAVVDLQEITKSIPHNQGDS